jgi:two-component system OmpR family response regulator
MRKKMQTPVLMLTARDATADRVRGLDSGADDYLVKPFDLSELYARLRALIRRSAGVPDSQVMLGDLTVDLGGKAVTRTGQTIPLTAREYAILEYLALHRGKVITRTVLFDHIFDEHADPNSNLLDVHVSSIRKKVGRDVILTRRGHGFYVEA